MLQSESLALLFTSAIVFSRCMFMLRNPTPPWHALARLATQMVVALACSAVRASCFSIRRGSQFTVSFFQVCVQYLMFRCISWNSCPRPSECKHVQTISTYVYIYILYYVIVNSIVELADWNILNRQFGNTGSE